MRRMGKRRELMDSGRGGKEEENEWKGKEGLRQESR
jgi:hypothetical protein